MKQVHLLFRLYRNGCYIAGSDLVAVYATRKQANAECKRLNSSPYTRNAFEVKSKKVIGN